MGDSTNNIYYSSTSSSRTSHSRRPSFDDEQNIHPHIWAPLPCETPYHPYLAAGENPARNISVQYMHPCHSPDAAQLDPDILPRRLTSDEESPTSIACHHIAYPESSQRTTSNVLSPYSRDASIFNDVPSCGFNTPLHGTQAFRRGSWPPHTQVGHPSTWSQSPPMTARSSASEPPESTSDESHQDSDAEEATRMSPMMNQFQIQSSWNIDVPPHNMYRAQALQPSVMTFQLSQAMQPVDDPENRHMLRSLLSMNIMAVDEPEVTHPSPWSTWPSLSSTSFGSANLQGPSMRHQHDTQNVIKASQFRMPMPSFNETTSPSPHSPVNPGLGNQRPTGAKQPKKSKIHQCPQCSKPFPRPSGLSTHMNTHSGAKPYKCFIASCEKRFAVRSNAKRHLRTHGVNPSSSGALAIPRYTVGFEKPMVTQVHDAGKQPARYKWIPHSLSPHEGEQWFQEPSLSSIDDGARTGVTFQASMSSATSSALSTNSDDDYDEAGSSSQADREQHHRDYNRGTDDFSGTYPDFGAHPR